MISNSSKYAIKALVQIVNHTSLTHKLSVKEIAEVTEIPKPYLSKILQQLSSKDYLSSSKGPGGGFYVTPKQLSTSLIDIIIEIEGKDKLSQCILNFEHCNAEKPCPIHEIIAASKDALRHRLKMITLEDLRGSEVPTMES